MVIFLSVEKFCAESLRMIIADPEQREKLDRGGARPGAGRKRLIDQHPDAVGIITDLIQRHSKSHDRRGDDILKIGCSATEIQAELAKHDISMCKQSIRYLMEPPRAGSRDAKRYNRKIKGRIQRSLINDKEIGATSTPGDIHYCNKQNHLLLTYRDPHVDHVGETPSSTVVASEDQKAKLAIGNCTYISRLQKLNSYIYQRPDGDGRHHIPDHDYREGSLTPNVLLILRVKV